MFDFGKFTNWLTGGLLDSHSTWETYKGEGHSWKTTATQFSAPLVVFWGLGALVLGWVFGRGDGIFSFLGPILNGVVWFGIGGLIASFLAEKFGGKRSFDQAFAALSFASIPAAVGGVVGTLPFIGWLIAIGGFIWSIMLLWQSLPVFLDIPLERRTGHFFATLSLSLIPMLLAFSLLFALGIGGTILTIAANEESSSRVEYERSITSNRTSSSNSGSSSTSSRSNSGRATMPQTRTSTNTTTTTSTLAKDSGAGFLGFGREVDYIESANLDTYSPPVDGMLQEAQVERTAKFFAAANRLREASTETFKKLENKDNKPSLGDFIKGVKGMVGAGTAEMQAVKSGGGNWAEHQWIKKQLFEARIHQDLNNTTEHNYELYQAYEAEVKDWL